MDNPETPQTEAAPAAPPPQYVPPPPAQQYVPPPSAPGPPAKSPLLAAVLSAMPGLGNIYNGLYQRGFTFFLIWAGLFGLATMMRREEPFLILCIVFFWLFNVFDAYRQATLINYGYAAEPKRPGNGDSPSAALIPGVALVVVGLYGILRKYFDFDLEWILGHWPIALVLFGGWLIFQGLRGRRDATKFEDPIDGEA